MIETVKNKKRVFCDICGHALYENFNDFNSARQGLIDNNWQIKKVDGHFEHYCPERQE